MKIEEVGDVAAGRVGFIDARNSASLARLTYLLSVGEFPRSTGVHAEKRGWFKEEWRVAKCSTKVIVSLEPSRRGK